MKKEGQGVTKRPVSLSGKTKIPELLAPGGSFHAAKAVLDAGADSVYTGLKRFSARAYAMNLTEEELLLLIDHAHLFGKTVHLTLNTLFKNQEIEEAACLLKKPYEAGLDAVLVQDFGLLSLIRKSFPGLPIHASTQMNLCTAEGAVYLKKQGIERVVLPRELSLTEIRRVKESAGLEVEVFCHGALCCSYSGLCQMSSHLGGRSANRGRCAGPCRLPYEAKNGEKGYLFSMKDLCTLEQLPLLQKLGVDSLKIEGRHKSLDYALHTVEIYRKYLDKLERDGEEGYFVEKKDKEKLLSGGSRSGFTDRYLFVHNDPDLFSEEDPSYRKGEEAPVPEAPRLSVEAQWEVKKGKAARLTFRCGENEFTSVGQTPEEAAKAPLSIGTLKEKTGQLGDTAFSLSSFEADLEPGLFLPLSEMKRLKREAADGLMEQLLSPWHRESVKMESVPIELTPYEWREPFYTAFVSEEEQLIPVLASAKLTRIVLASFCFTRKELKTKLAKAFSMIRGAGKEAYFSLPTVIRDTDRSFYTDFFSEKGLWPDGFYANSWDALSLLEALSFPKDRIVLDQLLYAWSNVTKAAFYKAGYLYDTIPAELKKTELMHRETKGSELVIYGRQALMHMAGCLFQRTEGCHKANPVTEVSDRQKETFFLRAACDECMNILYNGHIQNLLPELSKEELPKVRSYRYHFTFESAGEVEGILNGEYPDHSPYTKGLLSRGVE